MKVLVIPDVHLKPWMFDRAGAIMKAKVADRAVCLMDIPDNWNQEYDLELYAETFDRAISFQKAYPDTLWCYGNHDLSYIWERYEGGYSLAASSLVQEKLSELQQALPHNSQLAYVQRIDNVLFAHGGLTEEFVKDYISGCDLEETDAILEKVNRLSSEEIWKEASPVWARPQEYLEVMYKQNELLQVVGHTPVERIIREWNVISCDTFSTYRTGAPIGTEEYLLIDTITWEFEGIK